MKNFKYIDAIRGIAILGVFLVHVANSSKFPVPVHNLIELGAKGVQLFFIASAFTLFLSMDKRNDKENYYVSNFFIRRFFRIAPMYYLAIVYYYYQNSLSGIPNTPGIVTANFLFIHGIDPHWINYLVPGGWSITVEMMFYCIVPSIFILVRNLNKALLFLTFTLCLRFVFLLLMKYVVLPERNELNHDFLYWCLPNQLPIFGLGIFLFFYIKNNYRFEGLTWQSIVFFLTVLIINTAIKDFMPNHFFIGIGFIILIAYLSATGSRIFVNKFTIFLGKISFSLYLVHFAVNFWGLRLFNYLSLSSHMKFGSFYLLSVSSIFAVSILVAVLFYNNVEVRFQLLGKALIQKREQNYLKLKSLEGK
jgi:peptidoglycan/LPS O-acetylase OafA/YrhL